MDELENYELELLLNNYIYSYKNEYEIGRLIAYTNIQPHLDKKYRKKKMQDIYPLATDNIELNKVVEMSEDEKDRLRGMAKNIDINNAKTQEIHFE